MNKKIFAALGIIVIISLLSGCLFSKEDRAKAEEAKKFAKRAVGPYLENKYGMENIEIKLAYADVAYSFNIPSAYTGNATVKCVFDGREFEVFVTRNRGIFDNYQYPDMVSAVEKHLKNIVGYPAYTNNVGVGGKHPEKFFSEDEYFDGDLDNYNIFADIYILIGESITAIKEISDKLFVFVKEIEEQTGDYAWSRTINAYFFNYTQETVPGLDVLQKEAKTSERDRIFSNNLLAHIYLTQKYYRPDIIFCDNSIDKSELLREWNKVLFEQVVEEADPYEFP